MTPPASTEPMYLISESELFELEIDSSEDTYGSTDGIEIAERIRARGPVAQQAPADHELPAYICDEDNLGDIHDILTAALEGNDLSTLPRRWNQELGIIHSRSLAEHDAALIAQEREKWERERDQKYVLTLSALREISADVELKDYRKSCIHDPVCQWLCTAGNCPFHVALDRHNAAIAAQAREDVLRDLSKYIDEMYPVPGPDGDYLYPSRKGRREVYDQMRGLIGSLRSEVGK